MDLPSVTDPAAASRFAAPLAHVLRDGRVESVHRGHVAVVDAEGRLLAWVGEPNTAVYPRSTFKPFQALPLVESGAFAASGLGPDALALIAGSHGGTDGQAELARAILERAGADETDLACGAHTPYDEPTAAALRARGENPGPLRHNCSGKHAGMILLAAHLGAPRARYVEPAHPVQQRIMGRFRSLLDEEWLDPAPAVDGCSVPTHRVPLRSLARAYALLALGRDAAGRDLPALATIRDAMRAHPEHVASEGRLDTLLMRTLNQVVAKAGAEGVHAVGVLGEGVGIAVKIEDGARRALGPAVVSVLEEWGLIDVSGRARLAAQAESMLTNHSGFEIGAIRGMGRLTRGGS